MHEVWLLSVKGQSAQLRSTLGQAQRALLGNISDALAAVSAAQDAFDQPKTPPQLGSDLVNILAVVRYHTFNQSVNRKIV